MNSFVDTNILLDVLARRQPYYPDAENIWALAEARRITAFVSAISFSNCYYIVRKASGRATAEKAIRLIRGVFVLVPLNARILNNSIDSEFDDFEDAIQFHSALEAKATCLVTRNPKHFPAGSLPVLTPAEFLATHTFPDAKK